MGLLFFMILIALFIFVTVVAVVLRTISAIFRIILPVRKIEPLPPLSKRVVSQEVTSVRCRRSTCRGVNPVHARFCRQCGMAMSASRVDHRVGDMAQRTASGVAG